MYNLSNLQLIVDDLLSWKNEFYKCNFLFSNAILGLNLLFWLKTSNLCAIFYKIPNVYRGYLLFNHMHVCKNSLLFIFYWLNLGDILACPGSLEIVSMSKATSCNLFMHCCTSFLNARCWNRFLTRCIEHVTSCQLYFVYFLFTFFFGENRGMTLHMLTEVNSDLANTCPLYQLLKTVIGKR